MGWGRWGGEDGVGEGEEKKKDEEAAVEDGRKEGTDGEGEEEEEILCSSTNPSPGLPPSEKAQTHISQTTGTVTVIICSEVTVVFGRAPRICNTSLLELPA